MLALQAHLSPANAQTILFLILSNSYHPDRTTRNDLSEANSRVDLRHLFDYSLGMFFKIFRSRKEGPGLQGCLVEIHDTFLQAE